VEVQALTIGAVNIVLGAAERARGFYEHLGFRGKHAMREKQLPLPGPVRDLLTSRRLAGLGDLEAGVIIARLPGTPSAPSGRVETAGS
jgi:hypothetical protein